MILEISANGREVYWDTEAVMFVPKPKDAKTQLLEGAKGIIVSRVKEMIYNIETKSKASSHIPLYLTWVQSEASRSSGYRNYEDAYLRLLELGNANASGMYRIVETEA